MTYHQITSEERYMLSLLRKQGLNASEIARQLGRHRSTILREVRRNASHGDAYRPFRANEKAHARRSRSLRNQRFATHQLRRVERLLRELWSPEQIAAKLRRSGPFCISHETIYRHVWLDRSLGGDLYSYLRFASKLRRKRYRSYDSRGRLAGKRHISERPASIEGRSEPGHWEIDTVLGKGSKHCLVSIVERKSGYLLIGKLKARTVAETTTRTIRLIRKHTPQFTTITADNGTEFHGYQDIEKTTGVPFYFCTPHHAWERGTNENTNGLIRQYLPKYMNLDKVTQAQCNTIARKLNRRPRKRHDYQTPEEIFYAT
jgi:IS30 family transposase